MLHSQVVCHSSSFFSSLPQRVWRAVSCPRRHISFQDNCTQLHIHYNTHKCTNSSSPPSRGWNWKLLVKPEQRRSISPVQRPLAVVVFGTQLGNLEQGAFFLFASSFLLKLAVLVQSFCELCSSQDHSAVWSKLPSKEMLAQQQQDTLLPHKAAQTGCREQSAWTETGSLKSGRGDACIVGFSALGTMEGCRL